MKYCKNCGTENSDENQFCFNCRCDAFNEIPPAIQPISPPPPPPPFMQGAPMPMYPPPPAPKPKKPEPKSKKGDDVSSDLADILSEYGDF